MNWQAISYDWNQVRAFLATAEEGSFSAAARALGTTQPTLGRQVSALETALGVTLFDRNTRGLTLTAAGREMLDHVRTMGEAAARVSLAAATQSQAVAGTVTISCVDIFAAALLPPVLTRLRDMAPALTVSVVASNAFSDLSRREADIAIRHARPTQPDLIARHITDYRAALYAASDYLDRMGRPRDARDLADHAFMGSGEPGEVAVLQDRGLPVTAESFRLRSENGTALWQCLRAGLGVMMFPQVIGDQTPGLERVLPDLPPLDFPVWLATHRELHTSRRIRTVFDTLAEALRDPRVYLGTP
jgi:DNA-binding transcriptional LysR family regulator